METFKTNLGPDENRRLNQLVEERVKARVSEHGEFMKKEDELAAPALGYSHVEMEDVPYELFMARQFVKMFPDEKFGPPKRLGGLRRFFQRVMRRILRQQIVFNEFSLGAIEELNRRLVELERRVESLRSGGSERKEEDSAK